MLLRVEIPDEIARSLGLDEASAPRRILEALALEAYRSLDLSRGQVGELLGLGLQETEGFLKAHNAFAGLGPAEHLRGLNNLERALAK